MNYIIRKHYPIIVTIVIFCLTLGACLLFSTKQNRGHLVYALDDPYIHMAMAKNFSQYGVWGVTKYGFSSSSSSLLWTLILSFIYFLCGTNEIAPFVINIIFGIIALFLFYVFLKKYRIRSFIIFIGLLAIIFFTPLISLVFCGQEHILHLLITIAFAYLSAAILSKEKSSRQNFIMLLILAPLLTMSRYEGLFLLFATCFLFAIKRKLLHAMILGLMGILPVAAYGMLSISQGWNFLPNSILLKASFPDFCSLKGMVKSLGLAAVNRICWAPHIFVLIITALFMYILRFKKQKSVWENKQVLIIIFVITALLHIQFAGLGWFYRYEAYLVALGLFVMIILIDDYFPGKFDKKLMPLYTAAVIFGVFIIFPLVRRGVYALIDIPRATKNIYEQQYQMGLFVKKFYQGKQIAANDIGAINYLADINCLDLVGIGSQKVFKAKASKSYSTDSIYKLAKESNIKIAIVYDFWFKEYGGLPPEWVKIGEWEIKNNVICGGKAVAFYAAEPLETGNLMMNLRLFSSRLPKDVIQRGGYIKEK